MPSFEGLSRMRGDARKRVEGYPVEEVRIEAPKLNVRPNSIMVERTFGRFRK